MNYPTPDPERVNCFNCYQLNLPGCVRCGFCTTCQCHCKKCRNCTTPKDWRAAKYTLHPSRFFCPICGMCRKENFQSDPAYQCRCRGKRLKYRETLKGVFTRNELPRGLGLELEFCKLGDFERSNVALPNFQIAHDGSVNGDGMELVLAPLIGDNYLTSVLALGKALIEVGAKVDESCGFHVHVGADGKEWGPYELRRMIQLYANVEKDIYGLCAPGRGERMFREHAICAPFKMKAPWYKGLWAQHTPQELRKYILQWLYGDRLRKGKVIREVGRRYGPEGEWINAPDLKNQKYDPSRYMGLNLHSWMLRETIEWRHHEGTLDLERLVYWPLLCGWITELASALKDAEVRQVVGLRELVSGVWIRPFKFVSVPGAVREWTLGEMEKRGL
jgi:Putative amidoligase enzyme